MDLDPVGDATFYNSLRALGTIGLGQYTTVQETAMIGNLNASHKGRIWYDTTNNEVKAWNGTQAVAQAFLDATNKLNAAWLRRDLPANTEYLKSY